MTTATATAPKLCRWCNAAPVQKRRQYCGPACLRAVNAAAAQRSREERRKWGEADPLLLRPRPRVAPPPEAVADAPATLCAVCLEADCRRHRAGRIFAA